VTRYRFDNLDVAHFLDQYWQKQPLLIPGGVPAKALTVAPDVLAGLALEDGVESRIVSCHQGIWELANGPFTEADFRLAGPWTLLVQGVDRLLPEMAALKEFVGFLPSWRYDDVMISYATDGGSVGPHFDQYDVFLVQGAGTRRWRLGERCHENTPKMAHKALNLLANFTTKQEYLLSPGDVLYVPPKVAHWGVAEGECVTYSIGFRAPRLSDLIARLTDQALEAIDPQLLLADPSRLTPTSDAGELTQRDLQNARDAALNALEALDSGVWLGELITEQGEPCDPVLPQASKVVIAACAKVNWLKSDNTCRVFANGRVSAPLPMQVIPTLTALCRGEVVPVDSEHPVETLFGFLDHAGALIDPSEHGHDH